MNEYIEVLKIEGEKRVFRLSLTPFAIGVYSFIAGALAAHAFW